MIETTINLSNKNLQKFASRDDYVLRAQKFIGNRLIKIALNELELKKRIPHYNENPIIRDASKNATILFNNHVGLVSTVNELEIASQVDPEEYVFFRCRAIDAGGFEKNSNSLELHGANDNGDYFSAEELLKPRVFSTRDGNNKEVHAFETFVGKLFFTNHKNDDVSEGKGMIINSYYDLEDHCVYCDIMVDAIANPELARAIQQGYLKDVSMGCAVEWSECSVCGNKANNINEYCEHIRNHKGRKFSGKEVYEINHDLKFIEISAVTEGAFKNCTIDEILSQDELLNTVKELKAAYQEIPLKTAYQTIENCKNLLTEILSDDLKKVASINQNGIIIEASEEHLGKLYKGLDLIREVIMDMIQLENIDYDYVSDLTKIMKDLQASIFDLASAGFNEEGNDVEITPSPKKESPFQEDDRFQQGQQPPDAGGLQSTPNTPPQQQNIPQKEDFPLAAKKVIKKEDLFKISDKMNSIITDCNNIMELKSNREDETESMDVKKSYNYDPQNGTMIHSANLYPFKMEYDVKNDMITIGYHGSLGKYSFTKPLSETNKVFATLLRNDPASVLEKRIKQYKDHTRSSITKLINSRGNKMSNDKVKTAATDKILYRQLEEDLGRSNSRHVRDTHEVDLPILEGLLDDLDTTPETGASEYMLEGKIQSGNTSNERINPPHEADKPISEKQLSDNNRRSQDDQSNIEYGTGEAQFEQRSGEYTTSRHQPQRAEIDRGITEGQMDKADDLGNKRLEYALLSITEDQMSSKREDDSQAPSSGQTKWSGDIKNLKVTAKDVADLAITALTNAIVKDGISPKRIAQICSKDKLKGKELTAFNSNDSIQKFSSPLRSEEDIANRIALRIAEINHNYGLSGDNKNLTEKWNNVLNQIISSFGKDTEKFIRVLSNKSIDHIKKLENVVSGNIEDKTEEQEIEEKLSNLLDEYLPKESQAELMDAILASEDFEVIVGDGSSEYNTKILSKRDGEDYIKQAKAILQDLIERKLGIKVSENEINIEEIDDSTEEFINCRATISSRDYIQSLSRTNKYPRQKTKDYDKSVSEDYNVDNDEDDDAQFEKMDAPYGVKKMKKKEINAMTEAIKTVFSQQAPGGFVGGPNFGGQQDQQGAGVQPPAGDAGLGAMSTPPPDDFQPMDTEEDNSIGSSAGDVGKPKLPGMRCPVCGSIEDLENIDNKIRCGTCSSEWITKVAVEITKNTAFGNEDDDVEEVQEEGLTEGEDIQNELASTPTGSPGAPMASKKDNMKKIAGIPTLIQYTTEPEILACNTSIVLAAQNKLTNTGEIGYPMAPGHRCPNCGSLHTYCENSAFQCVTCGIKGKFRIAQNKDDKRFADIAIAYISKSLATPDENIRNKYKSKISTAKSVMTKRASITNLEKPVEESLNDVVSELHEDGYSLADAQILKDVIVESMIAEQLNKENIKTSEGVNMSKPQDQTIKISTEEEVELDQALASSDVFKEMEKESKSKGKKSSGYIKPSPSGNNMNRCCEEGEEDDLESKSQVEMLEEEEEVYNDPEGEEVYDDLEGAEDIVILEDDEDAGMDGDLETDDFETDDDLVGGEEMISIDIDTPDDDIHIEVDDAGHIEIDQGYVEDDESPDYFGEEDETEDETEESEEDSLDVAAPDLDEDFMDEDDDLNVEESSNMEDDSVYDSDSDPEIKMIQDAALMNTRSIHKMSDGFGNTMNWDLIARAMGKSPEQITKEANKIRQANAILESKNIDFGNPNEVIRKFLQPKTAHANQTMPLDVADEVADPQGVGGPVPRKPEKGFKDVDYNPVRPSVGNAGGGVTEVKTDKYQKGSGGESGSETSVIPRSKGDSGIKGWPKPEFAEEKANAATSKADKTVKATTKNNIVQVACLKKKARNEQEAVAIFAKAQNVPEEFIEYADFDNEFLVRDTRDTMNPQKKFFKIRKATNKK